MSSPWKTARTGPEDGPLWRADLLMGGSTSTSTPQVTNKIFPTAADRAIPASQLLKDVGILQFWDSDARPTIAFQLRTKEECPTECGDQVYENAIFRKCYPDERRRQAFLSDTRNKVLPLEARSASFSIVSQGRPCTCTVLHGRWLVVGWNTPADPGDIPHAEYLEPRVIRSLADDTMPFRKPPEKEAWRKGADVLGWSRFPNFIITPHMKSILEYPWHKTSMGAMENWSTVLRLSVSAMVLNPDPRTLYWGSGFTTIYNEHCIPIFGEKHPMVLGTSPVESWPETWAIAEPMFLKAMYEGKAAKVEGQQCFIQRQGTSEIEETFFDSTFLPIPGIDDGGNGVLNQFVESTDKIIERRQQAVINGINASAWHVGSVAEYWTAAMNVMRKETIDIPYALLFTTTSIDLPITVPGAAETTYYHLQHMLGMERSPLLSDKPFQLNSTDRCNDPVIAAIRNAHQKDDEISFLSKTDDRLPEALQIAVSDRGFGDIIKTAAIMPIQSMHNSTPVGFLIIGLNPRRPFDARPRTFVQVLRDSLTKAVATANLPSTSRDHEKVLEELHQSLLQRLHQSTLESKRLKARFERMYDTVPVGMFMFTPDGKTPIYVNDEWCSMLDLSRVQVETGEDWGTRIHEDDIERVLAALNKLIVEHTPVVIEFRTKNNWQVVDEVTGHPIQVPQYLHATCVPEFDEEGKVLNLQGWLVNVSHDRFTQRLLSSRLDEVTQSKQNAENFIDMVSHEMRNPLSAILQSADGISNMLRDRKTGKPTTLGLSGDTTESVLDAADTIVLCAQHQKRIVDDILTLSKLDANLLVIAPDKSNPSSLLRQAIKMFEAQLSRADIHASVEVHPSISLLDIDYVMMDSSRVLQVIINLLTNAIKFTTHARKRTIALVLSASLTKPRPDDIQYITRRETRPRHSWTLEWGAGQEVYLSFMVRDTGKGLTEEERAMLFQKFSQASPKTYKKYGGSGLGLFISRELTELQGGQIGVSSREGKGSTFAFYVLTRRWLPCTPMSDGSGRRFDIHTPTMLESPVAYSRRESSAMFDSTSSTGEAGSSPSGSGEEREQKLTVLIVEDNVINQKVMAKQIRVAGHEVYVANHGLEALEFLKETTFWTADGQEETTPVVKVEPPDYLNQGVQRVMGAEKLIELSVVLMDLEMPVLDGLSCVKQIRMMEESGMIRGHVPVIAVTANARSEQIAVALAAGMDEVVTKPFRIWQVLDRARGLVARDGFGPDGEKKGKQRPGGPGGDETRIDSVLSGDKQQRNAV
ncbi:Hybrid signal transduction histidine kinase K [Sphaceloma murrayae]|uniref:Hybrid signal transduction histidine kinase K n=1 Tax=Sphaceloma murrayae TaxID=2082308 RepID=A0A2K1QUX3_9PEZI|nr:Hybrid signal transduction histidine kinase K [Sphaceloma murrayae]